MNRHDYLNVHFESLVITGTKSRTFECNTLVFWNQGTQEVTIDGKWVIQPWASFTFECYPGEMNITSYDIVFDNDRAAGCKLVAICKQYLSTKPPQ